MNRIRICITTLLIMICVNGLFAQNSSVITGKITDQQNQPLQGIDVKIKKTSYGTATNEQGYFTIKNIHEGTYTLEISAINYQTQKKEFTVTHGKTTTLNFSLKDNTYNLEEVTITATGVTKSTQNIPGAVSVIDAKIIKESGAQNIGEIISRAPGVNFLDEDGRGLKPNIGLRGLNPNRDRSALILNDGKFPVGTTLYGDVGAYYFTPLQQIDRVEIIKGGAASVLYGGYSVGGVINLISKKASYNQETKADLTFGSWNGLTAQITSGQDNGKSSYFVNGIRRQGDSFRDNGDFAVNDVSLKYAVKPDDSSKLSVYLNGFSEDSETPGGLTQEQFEDDITQSNNPNDNFYSKRYSTAIDYSKNFNEFNSFNVSVYGNYFERDWFIALQKDTRSGYVRDIHNLGTVADYKLTKDLFGAQNSLIVGTRIHTDRVNSNTLLQETGDFSSRTGTLTAATVSTSFINEFYAYDEFNVTDKIIFSPGLRYTSIKYNNNNLFTATEDETHVDAFVYTAGLVYKLKNHTSIYANISSGFQPPQLSSALAPGTVAAGEDLDSETSVNYEAGIKTNPANWISASATAYYIQFKNKIISEGGVNTNSGESLHRGIEAELELGSWHGLSVFTNATIQKATFANNEELGGNILPYAPQQMYAAGIRSKINLKKGELVTNIFGNYVGKQYNDDENTEAESADGIEGAIPSYKVVNATIGYSRKNWGVNFSIYNLLDEKYFTQRSSFFGGIMPSPTRNARLNISYKF
ncbi:TonB-dependent receptor [Formosa sp. L2A11]|uniref:TonB-dependent receptor n=1 Tax=Formosa sp. L2A11 TaxID=2686363 RepID=UPI00131BE59F|nr:TonB-dependent receptor [Formosa sp. L2A11]